VEGAVISVFWAVIGLVALIYVLRSWLRWAKATREMPERLALGQWVGIHGAFGMCALGAIGLMTIGL